MHRYLPLLMLLLLGSPCRGADAPDWQSDLVSQDVQGTCRALAAKYPAEAPATTNTLPENCGSAALYDGTAAPPDDASARQCALHEMASANTPAIGGAAVLMMIYANGRGVKRDLDRAMAYACAAGGAPAEIEGRIHHLQELKTKPANALLQECRQTPGLPPGYCHGIVDFCDDITSGFMQGACAARASANEAARKAPALNKLGATLPRDSQGAFAALKKAAYAYFEAHADYEVDISGTGRAAFEIEARDALQADFEAKLRAFEQGRFPAVADFPRADKALNAQYAVSLKAASGADQAIGITQGGIRQTERLWLAYRHAWLVFAAKRYPHLPPDSLKALLTADRTALLTGLPL